MIEKFLNDCMELGNQARAEESHGNGTDTPETKKEFIDFFEDKLNKLKETLEKIKQ